MTGDEIYSDCEVDACTKPPTPRDFNSYEGNWVSPTDDGRIALRYVGDPNGSQSRAAAVANDGGNVVGIMPHPERAIDQLLGSSDGLVLLEGYLHSLVPA